MAFDPWAQYNQGLSNLGGTLSDLNTQNLQRQTVGRQNSLADLHIQQGQAELERNKLNAPMEAKERQSKTIILDDAIAQYGAKVAAGQGDINEYYKGKQSLERMKQMGEAIKPYMNKPEALKSVWPQLSQAFPEFAKIDPAVFRATPDGIMTPFKTPDGADVPNMFYLYDNEGKMQIKEVKPEKMEKGFDTIDMGNATKVIPRDGSAPYVVAKAASPNTVIKVQSGGGNGKPPSGYRYTANGDLEPIKGGPAQVKAEAAQNAKGSAIATYDETTAVIDKLLNHPGREAGTGLSSVLDPRNYIPGTDAKDFRQELASFDGKLFLANVSKMKGMGALSDAEGKKLTAAAGAIGPKMSDESFKANLKIIKDGLEKAKERIDTGSLAATPAQNAPASGTGGKVRKIGKYAVEVH